MLMTPSEQGKLLLIQIQLFQSKAVLVLNVPTKFEQDQIKMKRQHLFNCCRKTAVCNGDQLLDFSVLELVWSQSTFSTDPEVLQNSAGFTLYSSAGLAVGDCAAVLGLCVRFTLCYVYRIIIC